MQKPKPVGWKKYKSECQCGLTISKRKNVETKLKKYTYYIYNDKYESSDKKIVVQIEIKNNFNCLRTFEVSVLHLRWQQMRSKEQASACCTWLWLYRIVANQKLHI